MAIEIAPEVAERLRKEEIIWLTTTKADGTPLPNPVWFLWNGTQFLVFTEPQSVKMKNIARNPRVALHLNSDSEGGSVAIFQGEADFRDVPISGADLEAYVEKYRDGLRSIGVTREDLASRNYCVARFTPTKFRTVAA